MRRRSHPRPAHLLRPPATLRPLHPSDTPSGDDLHDDLHDDMGGLWRDNDALIGRRRALGLLGAAGAAGLLAACGGSDGDASSAAPTATTSSTQESSATAEPTAAETTTTTEAGAGAEIPDETQGPYPADGSNGPNVLTDGAVERADLTTSFGDLSGTAEGVPVTFDLTVVDAATGAARAGAALYLWHCTAGGQYSIYEIEDQNYLRGLQVADDAGRVQFTSIFPGCYRGRWPHAHFEVFASGEEATAGSAALKVSQLAVPEADCRTVYADERYGSSTSNLDQLSLDSDNVFADGWTEQLATVIPDGDGYRIALTIRI